VTALPFGTELAQVFGEISAQLEGIGQRLADADLQIAATALHHGLILVTGNIRHFERVPNLKLGRALADTRG
jgi:predicted nucleic acid-binding protein